jgi:hypothetical protein
MAMGTIRLFVKSGAEAERFNAAFYQFLKAHSRSADRDAESWILKTVPGRDTELKIATLWSDHAASSFFEFWNHRRTSDRAA